ncbi:UNVERIFIED_CONTAM: hypothetical protein K2H54_034925 [Gekko kuhli]
MKRSNPFCINEKIPISHLDYQVNIVTRKDVILDGMATHVTMSLTEEKTKASSPKTNEQVLQNVVTCVANLSLVSSTCDVCTACTATKDSHPVIEPVCNIPEMGIKMEATATADGVQPVLRKPEPRVTIAKRYACQGVDELEEKLLVLQQPVNKVISDTKEPLATTVGSAEGALNSNTVAEVKNASTGVTDVAPATAQGNVEATKSTVLESTMAQKWASNPFAMLLKSDAWLGQQLAVSAEKQGEGNNYLVHLGMLPSRVRQRYVDKMKGTVQSIQDALFHLQITFDLIEYSKRSVDQKRPGVQEQLKRMWLTWSMAELELGEKESFLISEPLESLILLVFRDIIQRLQTACLALRFHTQGLPGQVQAQIHQLETIVNYLQTYKHAASSFQDFPDVMLELSKLKILKARLLLHDLLDYVAENITRTWFGGPLASSEGLAEGAKGTEESNQPSGHQSK